ncbi:MAG: DctP family TRAP transporter solute-binding subunit [Faecalibacterium sp.]
MKKMTRRSFMEISAASVATATLSGCARAFGTPSEDTVAPNAVILRLADAQTETYPATMGSMEFGRLVEERTEGRVVIEVFTDGDLGSDETAIIEQVQFGAIDLARVNLSPMCEFTPVLNLFQLPFLFESTNHMCRVIDSELGAGMLAQVQDAGFIGFALYEAGTRNIYNSVRPVTCLADLQGLIIRVPTSELMLDMVDALGATGNGLAFGEIYSALQTGIINGAENNWVSYDQNNHYEVAQYLSLDGHTAPPEILVGCADSFHAVSASDMEIIMECAAESIAYERAEYLVVEEASITKVMEGGSQVDEITDIENFQAAVTPLYEKYAGDFMDEMDQIKAMA